MDKANTPYRVHQCSQCPGDTAYYCVSCPCDLCPPCKESHVKDLKTIDHDVVSHGDKINYIPAQEICMKHPSNVYRKYCELCKLPVCYHCRKHRNHRQLDVRIAYETKQQQLRGIIYSIRREALLYRPVLLPGIKADFRTCQTEFSLYQSRMLTKAKRLKDLVDYVLCDLLNNVFCYFDFKHRCLKQKKEMIRHIACLQRYAHIYEQRRVIRPLQFLSSIKTALPQIHLTLHTSQLSVTESFNKNAVIELLSEMQFTEGGNRTRKKYELQMMSGFKFYKYIQLTGIDGCNHISCATSDRIWVSNVLRNLILTNTTGVILHRVEDLCSDSYGVHTVNSEGELIYIDMKYRIKNLSKDMKKTTTIIERTDSTWKPRCVYCSPSTGDLLIGMYRENPGTSKVTRYNQSGQLTQTMQLDDTVLIMCRQPNYITENTNGDVVVSDYVDFMPVGVVVVKEREGNHRFYYTGPKPTFWPMGICTDALSHILVCDDATRTVHMLNKDGHLLTQLLTELYIDPYSLSYNVSTHCLLVGGENNELFFCRYIDREDALKDEHIPLRPGGDSLSCVEYLFFDLYFNRNKAVC